MSSLQAPGAPAPVPQLQQPYYGAEQAQQGGGYAYPMQPMQQQHQHQQQQQQAMWQEQTGGQGQGQGQYAQPLVDGSTGDASLARPVAAAGVPGGEYGDARTWQQGAGVAQEGISGRETGAGEGEGDGEGEGGWGSGAGLATPTGPVQGVPSFVSGSMGGSMGGGSGPAYFGLEELGLSEDELRSKSMQILAESDDMHQQVCVLCCTPPSLRLLLCKRPLVLCKAPGARCQCQVLIGEAIQLRGLSSSLRHLQQCTVLVSLCLRRVSGVPRMHEVRLINAGVVL